MYKTKLPRGSKNRNDFGFELESEEWAKKWSNGFKVKKMQI